MNLVGHVGLALIAATTLSSLLGFKGFPWIVYVILTVMTTFLPDVDLRLGLPHRRYTHNLMFVTMSSLALGYVTLSLLGDFYVGFFSVLTSGTSHLLGDLMTYVGFAPLYPLSSRVLSLRLFRSGSRVVNNASLAIGMALLILYFLTSGQYAYSVGYP